MKNSTYLQLLIFSLTFICSSCRTDQPLFAMGVYTGVFACVAGMIGLIYVIKKIL